MKDKKKKKSKRWILITIKWVISFILAAALLVGAGLAYLTLTQYRPAYAEEPDRGTVYAEFKLARRDLKILSFNIGYGELDQTADFFMDGGKRVTTATEEEMKANLTGIEEILRDSHADFLLLQEVDTDSARTFGMNQWLQIEHDLRLYESRFALDHSCDFVPYPLKDFIGRVHSGLATYSRYDIGSATRYRLPDAFEWPVSTANFKRCLLVTRIPIEESEQQLILINVHMDAYDDGHGKSEQTAELLRIMEEEKGEGNYVIVGGDFNQSFPNMDKRYPVKETSQWSPGLLEKLPGTWKYYYDGSTPSCRLLNQPYDKLSPLTQYYVIDGFIVSDNITVSDVETMNYDFTYSDHNPVMLTVVLD